MDKELQRLLEEARNRGASTQQLDDILARYNSKKKEQPEEPFQFGVSDTESLSPSQEVKEPTEEVAVDRSPTIGEWFGNIWNGLSEGVTDFLYPAAESTGLTDKNILSFVKQNKEEYPDLFEAYEKSLSNSAIQSNFTGEKAEELAARTAYSQYWESDPSIENKVVPFIRGERREEAVKKTGVEIPRDIKGDLDEQFWNSSLKGLASSLPAMVASSPTAGGSFVVQSYYAREEEIARTLDENPDLEMTEAQKEAYKVTGALVEGALEKIGLSGALKGSPALTKLVTAGVIDKALKGTKKVGKETLDRYINETVQEVGKRIAGGTLAEAETGALQQLSDDALKAVVNTAQGEEFFEPKSIANVFKDALYAGAQEAVGGGLISSVSTLGMSSNERKLKDIDSEIEDLKQKREGAATEEEKTIIDDVITDLTEEQNKEREESFKLYSKFSEQDLIEVQSLNDQIREVSSKYNVATSETLKDKYKQEVDDLRARKQELENKYSEEKDDSKEEERVPSTEQKEEAPIKAEPVAEPSKEEAPADRDVQAAEPEIVLKNIEDQAINYKDPVSGDIVEGTLIKDGQRAVVESGSRLIDIGNFEDIQNTPVSELGIEVQLIPDVQIAGKTISIRGSEYESASEKLSDSFNYDDNGDVVSVSLKTKDGKARTFRGSAAQELVYQNWLQENASTPDQISKAESELKNLIEQDEEASKILSEPVEEAKQPEPVSEDADTKEARTEEVEITLLEENGAVKPLTKEGPTKDPRNVQTGKMTIEFSDEGITFRTKDDTGPMKREGGEVFVSNEEISKMPNIGKFEKNTKEYAQHVASMSGIADPKSEVDPIERLMSKAVKAEDIGKEGTASAKRFTAKQGEQLAGMVDNFEKILKSSGARKVKVLFFNDSDSVAYRSYQSGKDETASKGSYYRNTIVVNLDRADMSTLPHEMMHAYISSVKMDNKKIVQFTNAIENELNKGSDSERKLAKELSAFRDEYINKEVYGKGKTKEDAIIAEEFLAQYVGLISTAAEGMPKAKQLSFIDKIRAAVVKFLSKIGIVDKNLVAKIKTREDALDFINGFVDALQGRVDPTAEEKVLDQTQPLTNAPVEISSSDVKQSRKQIVTEGTYIKESDLVDVKKLFSDFKKENKREPKVWIWMSDQLKRGQYKNEKTGVSTTLEGGVGFAYDTKNKSKNVAWASGLSVKTLKERIEKADFIWFMAGSEKSSFNFSKGTTKTIIAEIEAGMSKLKGTSYNGIDIKDGSYDEFTKIALEILKDDKTKKWSEVKKALDKGADVIDHPLRAKIAGSLLNAGTTAKMNLPIHQFLHETLGVPKLNEYHELIRDEFLKKNNYSNGDMSLIIKPTGIEADANVHDTYPHAVLGEVVGMPNKKNYVLDVVPEESKTVISKKTGLPIENAGTPVMIKTAVGDVGAIYEGKDLSVAREQIDWQPSLFGKGQVNPAIVNRATDVQQAASDLLQGKITNAEYQEIVRITQPIEAITQFYLPASTKDMKEALQKNKAELLNSPVEDGQEIGLRLDIPAYKDKNIWVVSVHGKGKSGKSISYGSVAQATDVVFGSNPKVASFIAAGKNMDTLKKQDKTTIARMLGKWKNFEGKTKEEKDAAAVKKVNEIVKIENSYPGAARKGSPWRQIGMNPFRHSYFYDRRNGKPVVGAAEVVQVGGLVYAKDVEYADWSDDQFTVNGYYDADGQPVRFQLDSDELTKIKDKAYAEIEKGKLSAPLYKKTWYQSAYNYLFRTELESKIVKLQEKKGSRIEESKKQGREIAAKIKKYAKTPEALKLANEYLVSENKKDAKEAILKLPKGQQLLNNLRSARAFIDNISNELVNDPAFDGLDDELRLAIQDNLSTYLRTQYRFFTDKKYNIDKRRKPAIDAQANQLLAQEIGLLSAMGLSPLDISTEIAKRQDDIRNEAEQMIDGYISDLKYVKYQPSKGGAGIKMPSAAFKRKKELPEYIEQLLGKEKDPIKKFSQTSEALANILYKGRMIDGIIDIVGENSDYILDVEPSSPKDKQYTKVNDPYSKLNGKWVHNEVMDMVNQESLYSSDSIGWQMYYSLVRLSRKSKVIWNFPSSFRKNLTGGWFFILTNGIVNPKFPVDFTRRTKRMFNVRGEKFQVDDETKRLASILADKGVTGASIDANLIGFSQATYQLGLDGDEGAYVERLKKVFNITSNTLSAADSWLQEKYSSIDDYTKLIIFRSEIQTYAKKLYGKEYSELNEAQQDNVHEEAAERVKQSTPTFSRLPKWFNKIAAVPVVAPFISFTMESIRSYSMNVANGASDIKKSQDSGLNDVQKKAYLQAGLRRLSGAGAALALRYAIVKLMTQWFLDDEDEELADDVRALRPDWMSGHSIIPRSIDKDGNVKVYNYSTEDPYNDISNILQGPGSWGELVGGFVGPDIAADVIMNIVKNKDVYGGSIADYSDSKINQTLDLLMYGVDKIAIPPTLSSSFREAWLNSDAPASEKSIEFFKTLGERSIIRDYKYNIISTFYQDINKISETRKTYEDYENPTKRLRQLDDIRKQYDAIVAIAFAKDNDNLIREAERALNNLDEVDREYVYEENR